MIHKGNSLALPSMKTKSHRSQPSRELSSKRPVQLPSPNLTCHINVKWMNAQSSCDIQDRKHNQLGTCSVMPWAALAIRPAPHSLSISGGAGQDKKQTKNRQRLAELGVVEASSNVDWPSRGLSCGTPVLYKQACTRYWGMGGAQHAIQHTKPHPGY